MSDIKLGSKHKEMHEFNKSDPTYRVEEDAQGSFFVILKGPYIIVQEFETWDAFANWAFEGGDVV